MKNTALLLVFLALIGSVSAYNQSVVNASQRTDGSDLGQRGIDTISMTMQQANSNGIATLIPYALFTFILLYAIWVFKHSLGGG